MSRMPGIRYAPDGFMTYTGPQHGTKPRVYAHARECKAEGCTQRLNRYNPGPYCHAHEGNDE